MERTVGGLLFGKSALNPSLSAIASEAERGKILNTTWNRYNAINVASFATAAATWFPGRLALSGEEIDQQTCNLVLAKDALFVGPSLLSFSRLTPPLGLPIGPSCHSQGRRAAPAGPPPRPCG